MPLNLLRVYNQLLDLTGLNEVARKASLRGVFNRDIGDHPSFRFRGKIVIPTGKEGEIPIDTLFTHLTCVLNNPIERKRVFELQRSLRLHWVKHHIEERKPDDIIIFSVKEPEGYRTYIYDKTESYVVVLEPKANNTYYFLLTAYYVEGKDAKRNKMEKKYKRRLQEVL